jgi:hypothetical protein
MAYKPFLVGMFSAVTSGIEFLARSGSEKYYLDPGSGSFLLQLLAATLFGGLFLVRSNWTRLVNFFKSRFGHSPAETDEDKEQ